MSSLKSSLSVNISGRSEFNGEVVGTSYITFQMDYDPISFLKMMLSGDAQEFQGLVEKVAEKIVGHFFAGKAQAKPEEAPANEAKVEPGKEDDVIRDNVPPAPVDQAPHVV